MSETPQTQDPALVDTQGFFADIRRVREDAVQHLRTWAQDFAEKNALLDMKEEFTGQEMRIALIKAFSDMNTVAPISIQIATPDLRVPYNFMMDFGNLALMDMSINKRIRNDLTYTDSQVSVDTEKFQKYLALLQFRRDFLYGEVKRYKQSINYEGIGAILPSSYLYMQWLNVA